MDGEAALHSAEAQNGIRKLVPLNEMPDAVADYLDQVERCNSDGLLRFYPGSPQIAAQMMRDRDRLWLYELHSTDLPLLEQHFAGQRQVRVTGSDGFAGLKAHLPPQPKRAAAIIDPPYEDKRDYAKLVDVVADALKRFPQLCLVIWYPQVARRESQQLPDRLRRVMGDLPWLHAGLQVRSAPSDGLGLFGSGVWVVNPPYTLAAQLRETLPWLKRHLALDSGARFWLDEPGKKPGASLRPPAPKRPHGPRSGD